MQIQLKRNHGRYSKYKQTWMPWLGEIPVEWAMEKLKFVAPVQNKKIANPSPELQYIALENVESWTGKLINLNEKAEFESIVNEFGVGDVLFGKLRPYLAKVVPTEFNGVCTGEMLVLRPNGGKILKKFLFYRLISNAFIDVVNNSTYGAKMPRANWSFIGNLLLGFPKPEEQKAIADYLDEKSLLIERIIEAKQKQIELLKEKRSALITRTVTKGIRTKVMFDTNAFDQWQKLSKKEQDKLLERVEIIYTHIQEDELPSDLRGILPSAKKVSTSGAVYDVSRYDHCTYGGEEDSSNISAVVGSGKKENHNRDALIANTAKKQNYFLITDDQRLQKKCSEIGGEAIPFKEFIDCFEMKDSGVEWIGKIPKEWVVKKLAWLAKSIGSGTTPKSGAPEYYDDGDIDWIITGDLNDGMLFETSKKITKKAFSEHSALKIFPKNCVVMAMYGATIGKLAITEIPACTNQACCVIETAKAFITKFCFYWLLGNREHIVRMAYGGGQPNINQGTVKNLRIPTPSPEEQRRIVDFLDSETQEIDRAVALIEQSISFLEEYKTSLISHVVTGKIKVTNS